MHKLDMEFFFPIFRRGRIVILAFFLMDVHVSSFCSFFRSFSNKQTNTQLKYCFEKTNFWKQFWRHCQTRPLNLFKFKTIPNFSCTQKKVKNIENMRKRWGKYHKKCFQSLKNKKLKHWRE